MYVEVTGISEKAKLQNVPRINAYKPPRNVDLWKIRTAFPLNLINYIKYTAKLKQSQIPVTQISHPDAHFNLKCFYTRMYLFKVLDMISI